MRLDDRLHLVLANRRLAPRLPELRHGARPAGPTDANDEDDDEHGGDCQEQRRKCHAGCTGR